MRTAYWDLQSDPLSSGVDSAIMEGFDIWVMDAAIRHSSHSCIESF